jgi:predicted O-methyltransferase YrrM
MRDIEDLTQPSALSAILIETTRLGFSMASEPLTGSLLRTLVRSKGGGHIFELGTGTGIATAWMLDGLDAHARLVTVEHDGTLAAVAKRHLGNDPRVTFVIDDAAAYVARAGGRRFDLIFADTWVGKFTHVDEVLALLKDGGFYVLDDMLPQPNWPDGHAGKVDALLAGLRRKQNLMVTTLSWASGIVLAVKNGSLPDTASN